MPILFEETDFSSSHGKTCPSTYCYNVEMKKKSPPVTTAFDNHEYLHSREGRIIRVMAEFSYPRHKFVAEGIQDTIVFFGSARLQSPKAAKANLKAVSAQKKVSPAELNRAKHAVELSKYYDAAVELSKRFSLWAKSRAQTFAMCSGGGPGIMEAANKGAALANAPSIGLNIRLPFEQHPNPYISDSLNFEFHYFFIRKFWFLYLAKALLVFPGGFGTLDEMMEILTLIQTKKVGKKLPVILYGSTFWKKVINFDYLIESGMISPDDLKLFKFCDDIEEAYQYIVGHLDKEILSRKPISKQNLNPTFNL